MSGFAAIARSPALGIPPHRLDRVAAALAIRGPDGRGRWSEGPVALVHSLLRTTREEAEERQPLSLDGAVWLAADARIDGRGELLRGLRGRGRGRGRPVPPGATAAELLLLAYDAWGEACVEHIIGDFAFALWNARRGRLFCARDHFGAVPFHYAEVDGALIVSNTLEAIRAWPGVPERLNEQALADYLMVGHSTERDAGFYAAIRRLPPAHTLTWEAGRLWTRRYWEPPQPVTERRERPEACVERFRAAFAEAVADRMRCDRLVVAMSGGIDSPLVAAAAAAEARRTGCRLEAVTVGLDGLIPDDEADWAEKAAHGIGVALRRVDGAALMLRPSFEEAWQIAAEPHFEACRSPAMRAASIMAAEGTRIILTGFGGDVAAAAPETHWADLLLRGRWPRLVSDTLRFRRRFGRRPPLRRSLMLRLAARRVLPGLDAPIDAELRRRLGLDERYRALLTSYSRIDPRRGLALHAFWAELLMAGDPEATGLPVRFRHPFFDLRVLAAALSTPPIPWLQRKTLLREAARGLLPAEIVQRPKAPLRRDPYREVAVRGHEPWLEEAANAPELDGLVDRKRLLHAVRDPAHVNDRRYRVEVLLPISLALWLSRRGRSASSFLPAAAAAGV